MAEIPGMRIPARLTSITKSFQARHCLSNPSALTVLPSYTSVILNCSPDEVTGVTKSNVNRQDIIFRALLTEFFPYLTERKLLRFSEALLWFDYPNPSPEEY